MKRAHEKKKQKEGKKSDHENGSIKPRIFQCIICDNAFTKKYYLNKHIATVHGGIKPYKCDICDATFTQTASLKYHISSVHGGKKPFQCPDCEKSFTSKRSMKYHISATHEEMMK